METWSRKLTIEGRLGYKVKYQKAEVGKWYAFKTGQGGTTGYGKIVAILEDDYVEVEKYFEIPDYRPYGSTKWFDKLPYAI